VLVFSDALPAGEKVVGAGRNHKKNRTGSQKYFDWFEKVVTIKPAKISRRFLKAR
jgi:hypothetical protein